MPNWAFAALLTWAVMCAFIALVFTRTLIRLWRDPVFRLPVLVVESDDWGAGPAAQAHALQLVRAVLARHRDATGHPAVFSLSLVLAVPDGPSIAADGRYARLRLDSATLSPVLDVLLRGRAERVFALQLHGMEHYWPSALMQSTDPAVQAWCRAAQPALTEDLPSALQSRWVNAATLPAHFHTSKDVAAAVSDEVAAYREVLGEDPRIVVPPTFVWRESVEREWARHGIGWVVTPGCRYTTRDLHGDVAGAQGAWFNGQRRGGVRYLVRTNYFEPKKGRDAAYALAALADDVAQGRPSVLENHRDNFLLAPDRTAHALRELETLLTGALVRWPDLRFLSTSELCDVLERREPQWIRCSWRDRLPFVWQRVRHTQRLWKLLRWSGAGAVGSALVAILTPAQRASSSA